MPTVPTVFLKYLPNIVLVILAILMIFSLSYQAYHFFDLQPPKILNSQRTLSQKSSKTLHRYHIQNLALFGATPVSIKVASQQTENLPQTNLQLTLRGISSSNDTNEASALVEDSHQRTLAYRIGDDLPGNAKIVAIFPERIVIDRKGKKENLFFPKDKITGINKEALQINGNP